MLLLANSAYVQAAPELARRWRLLCWSHAQAAGAGGPAAPSWWWMTCTTTCTVCSCWRLPLWPLPCLWQRLCTPGELECPCLPRCLLWACLPCCARREGCSGLCCRLGWSSQEQRRWSGGGLPSGRVQVQLLELLVEGRLRGGGAAAAATVAVPAAAVVVASVGVAVAVAMAVAVAPLAARSAAPPVVASAAVVAAGP